MSGGTAAIKNFGFKTKLKRGPNAPLANTLVPKVRGLPHGALQSPLVWRGT